MGPLQDIKIIEMGSIGPCPFAGMMLADMGADVIVIDRPQEELTMMHPDCNRRGKRSIVLDLKKEEDIATLRQLISASNILFEGYRPGVMERLGLGPDDCLALNPKLIYGRMTGWGQSGPLADKAGHDINYIALSGALAALGNKHAPPPPPLNLVGDYGGGAMFLVTGILAAYIEMLTSQKGQVVDVAMTDGTALLMSILYTLNASGRWSTLRSSNILDGGAPFYRTYKTQDDKYIAIGAIESQFYNGFIATLGLNVDELPHQYDATSWSVLSNQLESIFSEKTRSEWSAIFQDQDVCFAPVLDYKEAIRHPHNVARATYTNIDGITQPSPAPRFSRTPSTVRSGSPPVGGDRESIITSWIS